MTPKPLEVGTMLMDTSSQSGMVMVSVANTCADGTRFFNPTDARKMVEWLELITDLAGSGGAWLELKDSKGKAFAVQLTDGTLFADEKISTVPRASGNWGKFRRGIAARAKWS